MTVPCPVLKAVTSGFPRLFSPWLVALALAVVPRVQSADAASEWTVDDVVNAEHINGFDLSPVAPGTVVWGKSSPDPDQNETVSHLFQSTADGETIQLTRGKDNSTQPRFSPDGRRIAFLSDRPLPESGKTGGSSDETGTQIWLLEGGEPYPLTELTRPVQAFGWRDNRHIIFTARESAAQWEEALKERKDEARVVEDDVNEPPVRLFEVDLEAGRVVRLSHNSDRITSLFVAPDGRHAVTIHERSLRTEYDNSVRPEYRLWDLESGTSKIILEDHSFNVATVAWSTDGGQFYLANKRSPHPRYVETYTMEVWRFDVQESRVEQVPLDWERGVAWDTEDEAGFDAYLSATPDGFLVWLQDGAYPRVARYNGDGGNWRREWLQGPRATHMIAFVTRTVGDQTGIAFVCSSASSPPAFFQGELKGSVMEDPVCLADFGASWMDKRKARMEVVRWRGARGETVEGLLHYPHDYVPGERRPLVLLTHGGPFRVDTDAWAEGCYGAIQLFCARGAFVLRVNYHGSSGYGQGFADSIAGGAQYYDLPVTDIERGVDALIARGLVDGDRIGAGGWSNGGILTLALITRDPTRYKAAMSGAAGFEWVADTAVCRFGESFNRFYFGMLPWEDPEAYRKLAPYYQADRIKAPLLIVHPEDDTIVPLHHGWMQYRALQQRTKTPVRFVTLPGEDHALKKLSSMRRTLEEELAWFDQYLFHKAPRPRPWLKDDSPIAALLARQGAKCEGGRYGVLIKGRLVPEVVPFKQMRVGRFEVTRAQFTEFEPNFRVEPGRENFAANGVSFAQAKAYCAWLSVTTGEQWRLPNASEAEELYARTDHPAAENTLDYWAGYLANPEDAARLKRELQPLGGGAALLREAGSFGAWSSPEAVFDLGGNVAEWTTDGDGAGVIRGGSADAPSDAMAGDGDASPECVGFRVVRESEPGGTRAER